MELNSSKLERIFGIDILRKNKIKLKTEDLLKQVLKKKFSFEKEDLKKLNKRLDTFLEKKNKKLKKKILVEHTSANPTSNLHIGRLRNSFLGNSWSKFLKLVFEKVQTRYYLNDLTKNVAMLFLQNKKRKEIIQEELEKDYSRGMEKLKDLKFNKRANLFLKRITKKEIPERYIKIVEFWLEKILNLLSFFKISFDQVVKDREQNNLKEIKKKLKKIPDLKKEGKKRFILNQGTKVFLYTEEGLPTYLMRDFCQTKKIFKEFDIYYNFLGIDHDKQAVSLKKLTTSKEKYEPIFYRFVFFNQEKISAKKG